MINYSAPASPPKSESDDLDRALKILAAVNDPVKTRANLEKIVQAEKAQLAAESRANDALSELDVRRRSLDQRFANLDEQLAKQRAEHEKRMADERRAHDERLAGRERDLAAREAKVEAADIEYQRRFADLERRLSILRQVGEF
jgi:hypothetical protein